jgi:putative PEP-CTERM system TPR-repeat lipoprotein
MGLLVLGMSHFMRYTNRVVTLLALLLVLAACGAEYSTEEHIARARQFIAQEKYDAAIIELKNALQNDGESGEARWLLGKYYLESGDVQSAEKELERAGRLGWTPADVLPALAESLLAQGKYDEVDELRGAGLEPEAEGRLLATRGLARLAQGELEEARRLVSRGLRKAPQLIYARFAHSRVVLAEGDPDAASAELDAILALEPGYAPAWSLLGDIRMRRAKFAEAVAAFDKAIASRHNSYADRFKRALIYVQLGDFEAAQADTTELLRLAPHNPGANYLQGLIHFQHAKYAEAITSLSVAEPAAKQFPLVLFFLGSAHLVEGNQDRAAAFAGHFHSVAPQSLPGRKLLATIRLQQGKYADVQQLLTPVLEANPDDVAALNLMANALLRDGRTDEGITLLSRVAALQPDSPVAQVRLGAGLLMGGREDDAGRYMETALELDPEFQQADILLVLNHLQKQDYEGAISAAQAYRRRNLVSTTPLNLLGRVYLEAGQPEQAVESFEKALTLDAADPGANISLAQMAVADGRLAAARQYYETVLAEKPDFLPVLMQLAMLDAQEGNEPALVAHLERAIAAHPAALEPRLLLARYHLGKGRPAQVAPLFVSLDESQRQSPQVLQLLAMAQLSDRDPAAAQFTLEQLLEATPDNAAVHHLLAMSAVDSGDLERGRQELQRALELDENFLPSRIALARLALATGSMDEFEGHLARLESQAPQNPDVLILRAAAAADKGDSAAALKLAGQAYTLAPKAQTLLALAAHQLAAGNAADALEVYRNWLLEHPDDIAVREALANQLQIQQRTAEAKLEYQQIVARNPDHLVALNNLAWFLREEQPEQALEYARKASEIAPESAEVLDTLAVVQYHNKDYPQARRSMERALAASPDEPSLIYHSAMIAAALGENDTAVDQLEALADGGQAFPEQDQARALLAQLKQ